MRYIHLLIFKFLAFAFKEDSSIFLGVFWCLYLILISQIWYLFFKTLLRSIDSGSHYQGNLKEKEPGPEGRGKRRRKRGNSLGQSRKMCFHFSLPSLRSIMRSQAEHLGKVLSEGSQIKRPPNWGGWRCGRQKWRYVMSMADQGSECFRDCRALAVHPGCWRDTLPMRDPREKAFEIACGRAWKITHDSLAWNQILQWGYC